MVSFKLVEAEVPQSRSKYERAIVDFIEGPEYSMEVQPEDGQSAKTIYAGFQRWVAKKYSSEVEFTSVDGKMYLRKRQ